MIENPTPMKASDILIALTSIDPTTVISSNARVSDVVVALQSLLTQVSNLETSFTTELDSVLACQSSLATCQAALLACQGG